MPSLGPRICVVVPVYNHGPTLADVVNGALAAFHVIVIDDGSTDETPRWLASQSDRAGLTVITFPANRGKAAALQAGFERGLEMGFTHAITIDADGQHAPAELGRFATACERQPDALIAGVRDLKSEGAPLARRLTNALSTFWFKVDTGVNLTDTQCGYRCYPLAAVLDLRVKSGRYAYELELLVLAAWAGIPLVPLPVGSDYKAATSRRSHFRPGRDFVEISVVHSRLATLAFCLPSVLRRAIAMGELKGLSWRTRWRVICRHLLSEHAHTPGKIAMAVGLGLFCGIAPIWGYQMIAAAVLAHRFRLNKAIALAASNISFPLLAPLIIAAGLVVGHFLFTGALVPLSVEQARHEITMYFLEWVLGSVVLAVTVGVLGALATYFLGRMGWLPFAAPDTRPANVGTTSEAGSARGLPRSAEPAPRTTTRGEKEGR